MDSIGRLKLTLGKCMRCRTHSSQVSCLAIIRFIEDSHGAAMLKSDESSCGRDVEVVLHQVRPGDGIQCISR